MKEIFDQSFMKKVIEDNKLPNLKDLGPDFRSENVYTIRDLDAIDTIKNSKKKLAPYKRKVESTYMS